MAEKNNLPEVQAPPLDGLNTDKTRKPEIIVSLTSYPARMKYIPIVLNAMLRQTVKPDRVILWLSEEQFPNCILPEWADMYKRAGAEIYFRPDDLKPHKKYYYAIKENPNSIVILADDDMYYRYDTVELLYNSYLKFPGAISALTVSKITFDRYNRMLRSLKWVDIFLYKKYTNKTHGMFTRGPSMRTFFASGHGTLFPPGSLHPEVFNAPAFKKLCLYDDELWLKVMAVMQGTPVVIAKDNIEQGVIEGSQTGEALCRRDGLKGLFIRERNAKNVYKTYNEFFGSDDTLEKRMRYTFAEDSGDKIPDFYTERGLNKRVVYTAVTKDGYPLKTPSYITPDWDYICFTDCPELISDFWQIRPLECSFAEIKALPHRYLADYDYSLWIDPNRDIISDIDEVAVNNAGGAIFVPFIYKSTRQLVLDHILNFKIDSEKAAIVRQLDEYTGDGYIFSDIAPDADVLFRKHNDPDLIQIMEIWQKELKICNEMGGIALDYVCKKHKFSYDVYLNSTYPLMYFRQMRYAPGKGTLTSALLWVDASGKTIVAEKITEIKDGCFCITFADDEIKDVKNVKKLFFMPSNGALALTLKVKVIRFKAGKPEELEIINNNGQTLTNNKLLFNRLDPLIELALPDMTDRNPEAVIFSGDIEFPFKDLLTPNIYETPEKLLHFRSLRRLLRVMDVTGLTGPLENGDAPFKADTKDGYDFLPDILQHKQIYIILRDVTYIENKLITPALERLNQTHQLIWAHGDNNDFAETAGDILMPNTLEARYLRKADYSFCESKQSFPTELDTPCDIKKDDFILGCWG